MYQVISPGNVSLPSYIKEQVQLPEAVVVVYKLVINPGSCAARVTKALYSHHTYVLVSPQVLTYSQSSCQNENHKVSQSKFWTRVNVNRL